MISEGDDDAVKDELALTEDPIGMLDQFVDTLIIPACEAGGDAETTLHDLIYSGRPSGYESD